MSSGDEDEYENAYGGYVPPMEGDEDNIRHFGDGWPEHFHVPPRLRHISSELVETVNDWYACACLDGSPSGWSVWWCRYNQSLHSSFLHAGISQ